MARVVVLYEDALAPGTQPRDYGPHTLLLWCLVDRTGRAFWDLAKLVEGNAKKGKEQVLAACRKAQIYDRARVVAVYDNDRVRELPILAGQAPQRKRDVAAALRQCAASPERTTVILLEENLETVLEHVLRCTGMVAEFQRKPNPLARDVLLARACGEGPQQARVRACVLAGAPALECLTDSVAGQLVE